MKTYRQISLEEREKIYQLLKSDKWSPEIIAGRMKHEKKEQLISHETIYKYIYSYDGQKLKLYEYINVRTSQEAVKMLS